MTAMTFRSLNFLSVAVLGLTLALTGCAGDDGGTDTDASTGGSTSGGTTSASAGSTSAASTESDSGSSSGTSAGSTTGGAEATFADVQAIFTAKCIACHTPAGIQPTPNLSEGSSYAAIVGIQSVQAAALNYVEAGDTSKSYLWHKINNTQGSVGGSGGQMPAVKLSDAEIATIESWISAGANM